MNYLARFLIAIVLAWGVTGCATMSPTSVQNAPQEPIRNILIATNLTDTMVVSFLGITIFENKITNITDIDFSFSQYALAQADSALQSKGFSTIISEKPFPAETLRGLYSFKATRIATAKSLYTEDTDALLLIEQGQARTGINYGHGYLLERHGLYLVRSIVGRRDQVKVPIIISFYDLRTGAQKSRYFTSDDQSPVFLDNFKHIIEAEHVTEADKEALKEIYRNKFNEHLNKAMLQITK
jgi:hypothetical protein